MGRMGSGCQVPGGLFLGPACAGDSCRPAGQPSPGGPQGTALGSGPPAPRLGQRTGPDSPSPSPLRPCPPGRHCLGPRGWPTPCCQEGSCSPPTPCPLTSGLLGWREIKGINPPRGIRGTPTSVRKRGLRGGSPLPAPPGRRGSGPRRAAGAGQVFQGREARATGCASSLGPGPAHPWARPQDPPCALARGGVRWVWLWRPLCWALRVPRPTAPSGSLPVPGAEQKPPSPCQRHRVGPGLQGWRWARSKADAGSLLPAAGSAQPERPLGLGADSGGRGCCAPVFREDPGTCEFSPRLSAS